MTTITKLSGILEQYTNKFYNYSHEDHISNWLNQFPKNKQNFVLDEITHIISDNFLSEEIEKDFLCSLISNKAFYENDIFWKNCTLLEIQNNGYSQKHLNKNIINIINKELHIKIPINDFSKKYLIYIDDFMFTGYHLRCDIFNIINKIQNNSIIKFVYLGWYSSGQYYTEDLIKKMFIKKSLNINCQFYSIVHARYENRLSYINDSDVFWPKKPIENAKLTNYIDSLEKNTDKPIPFRDSTAQSIGINKIFSSPQARDEIEWIFLENGIKIISKIKKLSKAIKPLGFSSFDGLGFGGSFFSYRNIPNNTPICIWWGEPSATNSLSLFYPLFKRRVYE